MKKEGYYSSGEFAKMAGITKKTLRYYDEKNIFKPSLVTEAGARFYTDADLGRLQQILLLKYLGFSLSDIREMLLDDSDNHYLGNFLQIQRKLVEDRIEQLKLVAQTIRNTADEVDNGREINWSQLLELIHMTGMENSMRNQYKNASNISARIQLHSLYSQNKQGWFSWIFEKLDLNGAVKVLEVGCGDGSLWKERVLPAGASVILSDISDGMLRDARRNLEAEKDKFSFVMCDCQKLPFSDCEFDLVIANHVLFYCEDIEKACSEISRVIKPGGTLIAGTYGKRHMREISELVSSFDERIILSAAHLYDRFGKENGKDILRHWFSQTDWIEYEDSLAVTEAEPLISYVLSCHGNQNQYIVDCYNDFKSFVRKKTKKGFHVTKEAGIFLAKK